MLWLAIHFPQLPLESILQGSFSADQPWAVVDTAAVCAANETARQRGIRSGMRLAAAYALCPDLQVQRRNSEAERQALSSAALWASQFTPGVAIETDGQILLELESSLKLFGGLPPILEQVRSGLSALGLTGVAASAPTAMGARCLAIAGRDWHVRHTAGMAQAIGPLPVTRLAAALGLDEQALAMLHAIGVRTIAEMDALPRSGFARRFGPGLLKKLDSAFGRCAEAHDFFVLPQRFTSRLELAYGTEAAEALLFAANRLFV